MRRNKTKNREKLKDKPVVVYLPTKMKQRWKDFSEENRMTMSRFVRSAVNEFLFFNAKESMGVPRAEMIAKIKELEEKNEELEKEVHLLKILSTNLDMELKGLRSQQFNGERPIQIDGRLISLLKNRGSISEEELLSSIGISPNDATAINRLVRQLDILQRHGLVTYNGKRWSWHVA